MQGDACVEQGSRDSHVRRKFVMEIVCFCDKYSYDFPPLAGRRQTTNTERRMLPDIRTNTPGSHETDGEY